MSPAETWSAMGYAARVILLVLAASALLLVWIVAERLVVYRRAQAVTSGLRQGLHLLAAIKVTAPMLGLLGTLLGLINALAGVAMGGLVDPRNVAAGGAEALLMTVLGLLIGLPAWWAHAFLSAWAERIQARAQASPAR